MSQALQLAVALLLALPAAAQAPELDLSQPRPTPDAPEPSAPDRAPDFSMDFSEPVEEPAPPELRPVLVIAGVRSAESAEDIVTLGRAQLLQQELIRLATDGDLFRTVIQPEDVFRQLGTGTGAVRACAEWTCFQKAAKRLEAERVLNAEIRASGAGSLVTLRLFDPGFSELLVVSQDSDETAERTSGEADDAAQLARDQQFLKKLGPFLADSLKKLATANGKLAIDNADASAVVTIDGEAAGTGSFDAVVPRGTHVVKVAAPGFLPYEQTVSVAARGTVPVKVLLVARPVEVPKLVAQPAPQGPAFYRRPGIYVAAAGVAAIGVGAAFGAMAKATETRAAQLDEHGISPLTRAEAHAALTQAAVANTLFGVGAAALAGGVLWVFLTPTVAPPGKGADDPADAGGGFGVVVGVGGRF